MCMPARRESERTKHVFFSFFSVLSLGTWGEDGKGCRRLSTLSGSFSLFSSGSGGRACTTLFSPTFGHSVFLERGAEIGGFGGSLHSVAGHFFILRSRRSVLADGMGGELECRQVSRSAIALLVYMPAG